MEFNFAVEQSKKKTSNLRINSLSSRIHKAENRIILLLCSLRSTNTLKQFLTEFFDFTYIDLFFLVSAGTLMAATTMQTKTQ